MTIQIGDVSVSIPVAISNWAKESDDNRTEFDGMVQSMMYAVNKVMKERNHVTPNPYQPLYDELLTKAREVGMSKDELDKDISKSVNTLVSMLKTGNYGYDAETLMKLLSTLKS